NRRVHVTVEDQALALATAGQRAEHVRSVGHQRDLARGESLAREPVVDVLAHRPLGTGGAVDVRQVEGHLHQLVDVDLVQHALGTCADVHARDSLSVRTAKRGSGALLWSIRWISARRLATATRWRMPPDSSWGYACSKRASPSRSSQARARST